MHTNLITKAVGIVGIHNLAKRCNVTYQAILKWKKAGRLPRTEWTGETAYSRVIEEMTEGEVTAAELLQAFPAHTTETGQS